MHQDDPTLASRSREQDERSTVWAFFWVLFLFKILSVVAIAWAAGLEGEAGMLLSVTTWPWLIIPGIAISGPLLYRYRLHRVRARRAALQRAEWFVDRYDDGRPAVHGRSSAQSGGAGT
jgi:hypothetical protein